MVSINPWEFGTYLGNGILNLVLGIVLFCVQTNPYADNFSYRYAKRYLAYCAFLDALSHALAMHMLLQGANPGLLSHFFNAGVFFAQLQLITLSLLRLIQSRWASIKILFLVSLPTYLLTLAYAIRFFTPYTSHIPAHVQYAEFIQTASAKALSHTLYILVVIEIVISIFVLIKESKVYRFKIDRYFSGKADTEGLKMNSLIYASLAYFFLGGTNLLFFHLGLVWADSLCFLLACICIINMQNIYLNASPAITYTEKAPSDTPPPSEQDAKEQPSVSKQTKSKNTNVEQLVAEWIDREDMPFLNEGITLPKVAAEINISPRLLSDFINNIYEVNFNTWINQLRIEYIKRAIEQEPELTLADLAFRTGFTDQSAMTKVFKRLEGMTPRMYKDEIKAKGKEAEPERGGVFLDLFIHVFKKEQTLIQILN